jgi:hypothetical protein
MNFKGSGENVEENPVEEEVAINKQEVGVISCFFAEEEYGKECGGMAEYSGQKEIIVEL